MRQVLYGRGVQTELPYPFLLGSPKELPNAFDLANRLVLVPCNASLGPRQIARVARALQEASEAIESRLPLRPDYPRA